MKDRKYNRLMQSGNRAGHRRAQRMSWRYANESDEVRASYYNENYVRGYTEKVYHKGQVNGAVRTGLTCAMIAGAAYLIKRANQPKITTANNQTTTGTTEEEEIIFTDDDITVEGGLF